MDTTSANCGEYVADSPAPLNYNLIRLCELTLLFYRITIWSNAAVIATKIYYFHNTLKSEMTALDAEQKTQ